MAGGDPSRQTAREEGQVGRRGAGRKETKAGDDGRRRRQEMMAGDKGRRRRQGMKTAEWLTKHRDQQVRTPQPVIATVLRRVTGQGIFCRAGFG